MPLARVLTRNDAGALGRAPAIHRAIKRTIDIVVSGVALVALAPLFAFLAVAIRATSHGPALYRQQRIGRFGIPFAFLKFRTMREGSHETKHELAELNESTGPVFKIKKDPRITPIGGVLRRWSLDELPQLIHVFTGEMSLVGPRPHLPEEAAEYDEVATRRLAAKPGITCIWQVSGRANLDYETWIAMDLEYLETWTLALDLEILRKTPGAVASGDGAY